jgi:hypothetical protein
MLQASADAAEVDARKREIKQRAGDGNFGSQRKETTHRIV